MTTPISIPLAATLQDDDAETLIGEIEDLDFGPFLDLFESIVSIFAPAQPSLQDILKLVLQEISDIFLVQLADDSLRDAAATLQNVQDFLANEYNQAVAAGEDNQQLYTLLSQDNSAPSVSNLDIIINKIRGWASDFQSSPNASKDSIACQAISFSLTGYLYCTAIFKERAKVYWISDSNPGAHKDGQIAEWKTMSGYAAEAVQTVTPIVDAMLSFRMFQVGTQSRDYGNYLNDNYIPDPNATLRVNKESFWGYSAFHDAYTQALVTGSDSDMAALQRAFQSLLPVVYCPLGPSQAQRQLDCFVNAVQGKVKKFGQWHQSVRNLLTELTTISQAANPVTL